MNKLYLVSGHIAARRYVHRTLLKMYHAVACSLAHCGYFALSHAKMCKSFCFSNAICARSASE